MAPFLQRFGFSPMDGLIPVGLAVLLVIIHQFNFLLFHILAEGFAIVIAILMCVVAWQMYPFTRNNYLMYLGCGYFWVGALDLAHAITYNGMAIFPITGANVGLQFWIGTRFFEAFLLLSAPWFLHRLLNRVNTFLLFSGVSLLIIGAVTIGIIPVTFVEGQGLTPFKVISEYIIIALLVGAIVYLRMQRSSLDQRIYNVVVLSIVLTICAELAFTFYVSILGISNLVGHIFKLFSFWLIFMVMVRLTLQEPFAVMSREANTYDVMPDATILVDENGIIRQVNRSACKLVGKADVDLLGLHHHDVFHTDKFTRKKCPICQAATSGGDLNGLELVVEESSQWLSFSLSHIFGAPGLHGMIETIRDISVKKQTEKQLDELSILNNSIVENLPSILFVKETKEHRYIEWNKAAEKLTGWPSQKYWAVMMMTSGQKSRPDFLLSRIREHSVNINF